MPLTGCGLAKKVWNYFLIRQRKRSYENKSILRFEQTEGEPEMVLLFLDDLAGFQNHSLRRPFRQKIATSTDGISPQVTLKRRSMLFFI